MSIANDADEGSIGEIRKAPIHTVWIGFLTISMLFALSYYVFKSYKLEQIIVRANQWVAGNPIDDNPGHWKKFADGVGGFSISLTKAPEEHIYVFEPDCFGKAQTMGDGSKHVALIPGVRQTHVKYGAGILIHKNAPDDCAKSKEQDLMLEENRSAGQLATMLTLISESFGDTAVKLHGMPTESKGKLKLHSDTMLRVLDPRNDIRNKYPELKVLWFYAGMPSGEFGSFPAHRIEREVDGGPFNPVVRPWYKAALEDKVNPYGFSDPYSDAATKSQIRTFWFKQKKPNGELSAIVGVDFLFIHPEVRKMQSYLIEFFFLLILSIICMYVIVSVLLQEEGTVIRRLAAFIKSLKLPKKMSDLLTGGLFNR